MKSCIHPVADGSTEGRNDVDHRCDDDTRLDRGPDSASRAARRWRTRCSNGGGVAGEVVLVPMHVGADGLADCVAALRHVRNFGGAIVSMPHKTAIVDLLDDLTPEARLVGAVNVIQRRADGRLVGTILDGEGFVGGLARAGHRVAGAHCLLAGAGGAASAVAFALAKHGCASLRIVNRTRSKADELAARVGRAFPAVPVSIDDAALTASTSPSTARRSACSRTMRCRCPNR